MASNHFSLYVSGVLGSFAFTSSLLHFALVNPWTWGVLSIYIVGLLVATQQLKLNCGIPATRTLVLCLIGGAVFAVMGFIPTLF